MIHIHAVWHTVTYFIITNTNYQSLYQKVASLKHIWLTYTSQHFSTLSWEPIKSAIWGLIRYMDHKSERSCKLGRFMIILYLYVYAQHPQSSDSFLNIYLKDVHCKIFAYWFGIRIIVKFGFYFWPVLTFTMKFTHVIIQ
jgi:hypothetical protein